MELQQEEKFILPDDDGNLILITEIIFDYRLLQNGIITMKGFKFDVDYGKDTISKKYEEKFRISANFNITKIDREIKVEF